MKIIKTVMFISVLVGSCMVSINAQTRCPENLVCLTPEAARAALVAGDTAKALTIELVEKDKAIDLLKAELQNLRIEFAKASGENSALRQNAISDRAIITAMIPMLRVKKIGLINVW